MTNQFNFEFDLFQRFDGRLLTFSILDTRETRTWNIDVILVAENVGQVANDPLDISWGAIRGTARKSDGQQPKIFRRLVLRISDLSARWQTAIDRCENEGARVTRPPPHRQEPTRTDKNRQHRNSCVTGIAWRCFRNIIQRADGRSSYETTNRCVPIVETRERRCRGNLTRAPTFPLYPLVKGVILFYF